MRQHSQWTVLWEAMIATTFLVVIYHAIIVPALRGLGILLGGG